MECVNDLLYSDRADLVRRDTGDSEAPALKLVERFSHGESVGIGMLYAAKLGEKLGYPAYYEKIRSALEAYELPTVMDYPTGDLIKVASSDKKRTGNSISFVLLDRIGHAVIRELDLDELGRLL